MPFLETIPFLSTYFLLQEKNLIRQQYLSYAWVVVSTPRYYHFAKRIFLMALTLLHNSNKKRPHVFLCITSKRISLDLCWILKHNSSQIHSTRFKNNLLSSWLITFLGALLTTYDSLRPISSATVFVECRLIFQFSAQLNTYDEV